MNYDENLYWSEWSDLRIIIRDAADKFRRKLDSFKKPNDPQAARIVRRLKALEAQLTKRGKARWIYETKAESAQEVKNCPLKDQPYTRCISCECRRELKKGKQFYAHHPHNHDGISTLRPAAECDTGR